MAGRILVADDHLPNRKLLQARLEAEYYDVIFATDGVEAVDAARRQAPDLVLMDVMMPRMDGYEACRVIKDDPATRHIPVVMLTALDEREDRLKGLDAGADDFLTKPIDDLILFARVRSLLRLKSVLDELRMRRNNGRVLGAIAEDDDGDAEIDISDGARILVVADPGAAGESLVRRLDASHHPHLESDPRSAARIAQSPWDLVLLNLHAGGFDGMRLAARLRSDEETRRMPILAIVDASDRDRLVRALDLGVNDVITSPVDAQELNARVRTLVRRKRYTDFLRSSVDHSMELAVTDQLTGLHNRRYLTTQLTEAVTRAETSGEPCAVVLADLDHFKAVNDTHGHDAGDLVLKDFAKRLMANVRAMDAACRYGGEEFVVSMPGASIEAAQALAERLRRAAHGAPFLLGPGAPSLDLTVSVGVTGYEPGDDVARLLKRADQALYAAKARGRNRVIVARRKTSNAAA